MTPDSASTPHNPDLCQQATADTNSNRNLDNNAGALLTEMTGEVVSYDTQRRDDLAGLAHDIETWPEHVRAALAAAWPAPESLPTPGQVRRGEAEWTLAHIPLLSALCAAAGAPWHGINKSDVPLQEQAFITAPPRHADNEPCERPTLDILFEAAQASPHLETVNGWLKQGHLAGVPWSPRKMPTVVNYERLRLALRLAEWTNGDDQLAWALISDKRQQGEVGAEIGRMSSRLAHNAHLLIDDLDGGRAVLLYQNDGTPRIVPTLSA